MSTKEFCLFMSEVFLIHKYSNKSLCDIANDSSLMAGFDRHRPKHRFDAHLQNEEDHKRTCACITR